VDTIYRYNRPDTMEPDEYEQFKSNYDDSDGRWLAEEAAEHCLKHCSGWDSEWPITLIIQRQDGSVIDVYDVDRESVPRFFARKSDR
jgi:hypothetical protein